MDGGEGGRKEKRRKESKNEVTHHFLTVVSDGNADIRQSRERCTSRE